MGAAIESFSGAELLLVPRTRFAPVKTTDDLLVLRSDVYTLQDDMSVQPIDERAHDMPYVELDKRFYRIIDDFNARFPAGPPSLREADRLVVSGDITFEAGVAVRGAVVLSAEEPRTIAAGVVLEPDG
jgi:UTP--glucose-1-phosphate uridylyltransferase